MLKEVVIQKDVPARVGMRVVVRKLILSLHPNLSKQSNGKPGTIVWIEPANAQKGISHGARVEVVWDGSHRRRLGEFLPPQCGYFLSPHKCGTIAFYR
jgi:hypothetical protein